MKTGVKIAIVGGILMVIGIVLFIVVGIMVKFKFTDLLINDVPTEMKCDYGFEDLDEIEITTSTNDIVFNVSPDSDIHVTYYNSKKRSYTITDADRRLTLSLNQTEWYYNILFFLFSQKKDITVLVPAEYIGDITLSTSTGDVELESINAANLSVKVTTGEIEFDKIAANSAYIEAKTGSIDIDTLTVTENLKIETTTGHVDGEALNIGGAVSCKSTTGEYSLKHIICKNISVETTTGDIDVSKLAADTIVLEASTGDISGSISAPITDYSITSKTTTGKNKLPQQLIAGDKTLDVETTTGNITLTFADGN